VQMPGRGGFDLLALLPPPAPRVVFVTAHDAFALRAFEVNALDYLLKPVRPERLAEAVARLLAAPAPAPADDGDDGDDGRPLDVGDRLFLSVGGAPQFVVVSDLACLTAADDYCELHLRDGRSALVLGSLRAWEKRLPAQHFVRVHRSAIIQYAAVERLEPWSNGGFRVHLAGAATPVVISRRYAAELRGRLR
jgi:two-component system, LytTR family, response regulator